MSNPALGRPTLPESACSVIPGPVEVAEAAAAERAAKSVEAAGVGEEAAAAEAEAAEEEARPEAGAAAEMRASSSWS